MTETALTIQNNLGHNVLALKEQAKADLIAMANLYYQTQVRGQADNTEDAKRRDITLFLEFYYAMFYHTHPRDWHASVTREFVKQLRTGEKRYSLSRSCNRASHSPRSPSRNTGFTPVVPAGA